ncbi:unnamed protein product, partial [Rotaria sp. Silwood1]
ALNSEEKDNSGSLTSSRRLYHRPTL